MPRRKIPLYQQFSMILLFIVVLSADFDASSINSSKYFLKFFHIRCCCHLALPFIFSPWPFHLLFSLIFLRQISSFSCYIFSSIFYRCIFLLITMSRKKTLLFSTTLFYDVSVHYRSFCWLWSLVNKVFVIIFCNFSIVDVVILLFYLSFAYARSFFFLPRSSFDNFAFFLFHFFHWCSFFCRCIVSSTALLRNSSWFLLWSFFFWCYPSWSF